MYKNAITRDRLWNTESIIIKDAMSHYDNDSGDGDDGEMDNIDSGGGWMMGI